MRISQTLFRAAAILAFSMALHTSALADVCSWTAEAGNWGDAKNWSCGHVPSANDEVIIGNGPVNLEGAATIQKLTLNQPDASRYLGIGGGLTITGDMEWGCCTIHHFPPPDAPDSRAALLVEGDLYAAGTAVHSLGRINLEVMGDVETASRFRLLDPSSMVNNGTFRLFTGGSIEGSGGDLLNRGTIVKLEGVDGAYVQPRLDNRGEIRVDVGTLMLTNDAFHIGVLYAAPEATLQFGRGSAGLGGQYHLEPGSTLAGTGTFILDYGSLHIETPTTIPKSARIIFRTSTGPVVINQPLWNRGDMTWHLGDITGTSEVRNFGTLRFGSGAKRLERIRLINQALMDLPPATSVPALADGARILNLPDATFAVRSSAGFAGEGIFYNAGIFNVQSTVSFSGVELVNEGVINLYGSLTTRTPFTHRGILSGTGTYARTADIVNEGVFAPGFDEPGILSHSGITPYLNSTLRIDLKDLTGPGKGHDQLSVQDLALLDHRLEVDATALTEPGTFVILVCRGTQPCRQGEFESVSIAGSNDYDVEYGIDRVTLVIRSLTQSGLADLSAVAEFPVSPQPLGQPVYIPLELRNDGPDDVTDVRLTAVHDTDVTSFSTFMRSGTCEATPSGAECTIHLLAAGTSTDAFIIVEGLAPGEVRIEAEIMSAVVDPDPSNNRAAGTVLFQIVDPDIRTRTRANLDQSGDDGDPVNTFTGELFFSPEADLRLSGPMPIEFRRYYASMMALDGRMASALGPNWSHTFDWRIVSNGAESIEVVTNHGRAVPFEWVDGSWQQSGLLDTPLTLSGLGGGQSVDDPRTGRHYQFDAEGRLTAVENGFGSSLALAYAGGLLASVSDGLGRTLNFTYTGDRLASVSDGLRTVSFTYSMGVLTTFEDAAGGTTAYTYDEESHFSALLTAAALPHGKTLYTQTYDAAGRVVTQTDASGATYAFSYDGLETTVTDPMGHSRRHIHDAAGRLLTIVDQLGRSSTFAYDAAGRRDAIISRDGNIEVYAYDEATGLPSSIMRADGSVLAYAYNPQGRLASAVYPGGSSEQFYYDNDGNIASFVDAAGGDWTYTYNGLGQITSATDPLGTLTTYAYSADGTLLSIESAAGAETQFVHDAAGRLTEVQHADGTSRRYTYNALDLPTSFTDELGATTQLAYDANGNLVEIINGVGRSLALEYDAMDRLVRVTDPIGNGDTWTFDALGRVATATDRSGHTTRYAYDEAGRPVSVTDPSGGTWSFGRSAEGALTSVTPPVGTTTIFSYDGLGRAVASTAAAPTSVAFDGLGRLASATDALGATTTFLRDANGEVAAQLLPGGIQSSYDRDALGRLAELTDSAGGSWRFTRDAAGRVTSSRDPLGRETSYDYDARGRIVSMTFPEGLGTATFTYDGRGNVLEKSFSDGTSHTIERDALGNLIRGPGLELSFDANDRIAASNDITMTRDGEERITSMILAPGKTITYTYDARDLVTKVEDWSVGSITFTYDASGRLVSMARSNGLATTLTYDDGGYVSSIDTGDLAAVTLTRDAEGRVVQRTATLPLVDAPDSLQRSWTFDEAHQIEGFSYDALGRRTADDRRSYTWNLASQLTGYDDGSTAASFTYDAAGYLLARSAADGSRAFVWNYALGLPAVSVIRDDGVDVRYFVHTPGGRLLYSIEADTGDRRFYHFDEAGSALFLTDDDGAVVASYVYTPYGEIIAEEGDLDNPFTFHGELSVLREGNSGLYAMGVRFYDAATIRFLSRDPIQSLFPKATNPYQFAYGDPISFSDPLGLDVLTANGPAPTSSPLEEGGLRRECGGAPGASPQSDEPTVRKKSRARTLTPSGGDTRSARGVASPQDPFTVPGEVETGIGVGFTLLEEGLPTVGRKIIQNGIKNGNYSFAGAARLAQGARYAKAAGTVVGAGISAFNEYQQASSEGSSGAATTVRMAGSVTTDLGLGAAAGALGPAGLVAAAVDGFTGQNYSNTVKQIARVPTVLLSDSRTQRNYVCNVKSGKYSRAVKETFEAGEVWAERGILGTLNDLGVAYGWW